LKQVIHIVVMSLLHTQPGSVSETKHTRYQFLFLYVAVLCHHAEPNHFFGIRQQYKIRMQRFGNVVKIIKNIS